MYDKIASESLWPPWYEACKVEGRISMVSYSACHAKQKDKKSLIPTNSIGNIYVFTIFVFEMTI
jgi:hypothetical protein